VNVKRGKGGTRVCSAGRRSHSDGILPGGRFALPDRAISGHLAVRKLCVQPNTWWRYFAAKISRQKRGRSYFWDISSTLPIHTNLEQKSGVARLLIQFQRCYIRPEKAKAALPWWERG
jgi:hypothetical protein